MSTPPREKPEIEDSWFLLISEDVIDRRPIVYIIYLLLQAMNKKFWEELIRLLSLYRSFT
jgi:hypothetical protein